MNTRLFPTLALSAALLTGGCTNPNGSVNAGGTAFLVGAAALLGAAALSGQHQSRDDRSRNYAYNHQRERREAGRDDRREHRRFYDD